MGLILYLPLIINMIDEYMGKKKVAEEMEEYCQKMEKQYNIKRGTNLKDLQDHMLASFRYNQLYMKNEDAYQFLEAEKQDIIRRRDAMAERFAKISMESYITEDRKEFIFNGDWKKQAQLKEYTENTGFDSPAEEYLSRIYLTMSNFIDDISAEAAILQKGISGEEYVNGQLRLYEGKYKVLQNIVIPSEDSQGNTSEVDVYIITDKGLVVAEVKNYGNEKQKLHITNDGRWAIEDRYGNILRTIDKSPVEQNTRHCLAAERLLKKEFGENCNIPIIPIIFIANNKVSIQNESRSAVYRVSEFYTFMQFLNNGANVSKEDQSRIEKLLKGMDIGAREFPVKSRAEAVDCLEEMERTFTNFVLYNCEILEHCDELIKKYNVEADSQRFQLKHIPILVAPYILVALLGISAKVKWALVIAYTIMLVNVPIGLIIGTLFFVSMK